MQGGFRVDGYNGLIPYSSVLPSQDGEYWGFWRIAATGEPTPVYCFFAPAEGV